MAQDRFIYWEREAPSTEQVGQMLEDYLGEFATGQTFKNCRHTVLLIGAQSNPHRRVGPWLDDGRLNMGAPWDEPGDRWIEVFVHDDCIDVITRMADPATCALADGFVQLAARRWSGRIEHG